MAYKIINYGSHNINKFDIKSVTETLNSAWLSQGPRVKNFEKKLSRYLNSKYSIVTTNGTSALYLAGKSIGWSKESNILMSPVTFVAGANAAELCNSKIYFADIDNEKFCLDPNKVEYQIKKLKNKIHTVIATDYAGNTCDWKALKYLSKKYEFYLVNDNCHAFGAKYFNSRYYSSKYADITCLSFHPVKHITTGEGGAVLTNNKDLYKKIFSLRENGVSRHKNKWFDYDIIQPSLNFRMSDIQASLGISQLKRINLFLNYRKKIAKLYDTNFKGIKDIKIPQNINNGHAYHLYPLIIDFEKFKIDKEKFIFNMKKKYNIKLQVHYKPIYSFAYYKKKYNYKKEQFPVSNNFFKNSVSLPIYFGLKKNDQLNVIKAIKKILKI